MPTTTQTGSAGYPGVRLPSRTAALAQSAIRQSPVVHPAELALGGSDTRPAPVEPSAGAVLRREALYRRLLAAADLCAAAVAIAVSVAVIGGGRLEPVMLTALPLVVIAAKLAGLYDRDELLVRKTTLDEAPKIFHVATLYALVAWLSHDLLLSGELTRPEALSLWATLFFFTVSLRAGARAFARRIAPVERCLLIGDQSARRALEEAMTEGTTAAELVGQMDLSAKGNGHRSPLTHETLAVLLRGHDVHRVIVAPGQLDGDEVLDVIGLVKECGVRVSVLPRLFEVVGSSVEFDRLDGLTLLAVRRFGLSRSSALIKRSLDLTVAGLALLVLAPLLAVIAVAVKLDSRGPVLFRQARVGREGQRFEMLKFRTMCEDAEEQKAGLRTLNEADGLFKIADDPRVTRVGRILRPSSLDELPQLWNVLRGDMSVVGPRPLVVDEDERVIGRHRRRLQLKPGMTGQWQVLGSTRVPLSEMLAIDYLYVGNWSLWADIKILMRTVPHVLARRGL